MRMNLAGLGQLLLGDREKISLEHRIFNTLSFLCMIFGILSVIQNLLLRLHFMTVVLSGLGMLLLTTYYLVSRFRNIFRPLVWPLIMTSTLLIAAIWFFNGGSLGGNILLYLVMLFFFMVMTRSWSRVAAVCWTILVPLVVVGLEYLFPDWNIPYDNTLTRYIDLAITFLIAMVILGVGTTQVIENYHRERSRAEERAELLRRKQQEMDRELELAQKIQLNLMPLTSQGARLAYYYHPMERVGGDFFDFIPISESELGIFVSDVSGHGVPAAFITSLIKSHTMQPSELHRDPAGFLMYLNELLLDVTASHFVTSFYGVLDRRQKELHYANAGHPPPLLVYQGTVSELGRGKSGLPLAVFPNKELEALGKTLITHSTELQPGTQIVLCTDGLLEAVNIHEKMSLEAEHLQDFEQSLLYQVLSADPGRDSGQLVASLVQELVAFRGGDEFDDDVCIISLQI